MKLKLNLRNLALLSALAMTSSAFAGAAPAAHAVQNPIVLPAADWTRNLFVGVGLKTEWIRGQRYSTAAATYSGGPTVLNAHDNYTAWVPEFTFGYHFNQTPVLSSVFGQSADVDFVASGFRANTRTNPKGSATGSIFGVDGTVYATDVTVRDTHYKGTLSQYNLGLNYLGHWAASRFTFTPSVGLAYHNMYENSRYNLQTYSTTYIDPYTYTTITTLDSSFRTRTQYAGLAFGNNFAYQFANRWQALADINIEALYAHSHMTANSTITYLTLDGSPKVNARATSSLTKDITGKGTVDAGLRYAFSDRPDAMSLKLLGGVEAWSYVPEVVTSAAAKNNLAETGELNGTPTHLSSQGLVNPFVALEFVAPF